MKTSKQVIEALCVHCGDVTPYRVAQLLGVTNGHIYQVMAGKPLGEKAACKAADLLGVPRAQIIAIGVMERSKDETTRASWMELLERAGVAAFACVFFTSFALTSPAGNALELERYSGTRNCAEPFTVVYIMRRLKIMLALMFTLHGFNPRRIGRSVNGSNKNPNKIGV